jgi:anti-sigma B factor antagonist
MDIHFDIINISPVHHAEIDYTLIVFNTELPGELTIDNSSGYWIFLKTLVEGGARKILLKMDKVEYIDSSGIGMIINTTKLIRSNSGDLILSSISKETMKILEIVSLQDFIKVFNSEPEAVNYFRYINRA